MQMSNAEICTSFKQAKNQNDQITILAELNACGTEKILEILQAGGCISGLPKVKKKLEKELQEEAKAAKRSNVQWTPEMDRQLVAYCEAGESVKGIAELMGLRPTQIKARKEVLNARGYIVNTAQTAAKEAPETQPEAQPAETVAEKVPENIPQDESAGDVVEPLGFLYNCLPWGVKQISATTRFVDDAGNVWKLELNREN